MNLNTSNTLKSKVLSLLRRGELNPMRIGEMEARMGCSLNLNAEDVALAVAVWENRQSYHC